MITREFNLYLHAGHSIPLVINVNQYDRGESWVFTLFNSDGTQYTPSSGAIVGIKSDNLGIINTAAVDSQGRVVVAETQQMTAAVGKAVFELVIDDGTHGTANFVVLVEPKPGDNADLSESDISMIEQAIEAASTIKPYGSPLVASTVAGMTDHEKVYVYVGSETGYTSGHWYYYDGDSWEDGGVYNSVAVQTDTTLTLSGVAADSKKVGDEISELKSQIEQVGSGVPSAVKTSIYNLFSHLIYKDFDPTTDATVIRAWAEEVTAITLNRTSISISGSNTYQLVATTTPSGGAVSWQTSDSSVATVSPSGLVTGTGNGTCTITATSGSVSATCSATVTGFATLSSISAVYTQSGRVYPTTPLNDLKSDLVVTAHYSDSSTQTVADSAYTLSGTLAEGTSTVTVSYGGFTTTFTVTVSPTPVVPSEYQSVEWVGRTATTAQVAGPYIVTDITESAKADIAGYSIDLSASISRPIYTTAGTVNPILGWGSAAAVYFGATANQQAIGFADNASNVFSASDVPLDTKHDFHVSWDSTGASAETGTYTCSRAFTATALTNPTLHIGTGFYQATASGTYKIYGNVVVKKNDTIVGNFYPCYRKADNVIGFYDSVSGNFYQNAGSGSFAKGDDI